MAKLIHKIYETILFTIVSIYYNLRIQPLLKLSKKYDFIFIHDKIITSLDFYTKI